MVLVLVMADVVLLMVMAGVVVVVAAATAVVVRMRRNGSCSPACAVRVMRLRHGRLGATPMQRSGRGGRCGGRRGIGRLVYMA